MDSPRTSDFNPQTQFLHACRLGNETEMRALLHLGADPEYEDEDDPFASTPLSEAVRRNKIAIVRVLINECNVDVNHCIKHNISPLYLAVERGHIDLVRLLLSCGADFDLCEDFNDDSPLHLAAQKGHTQICQIIISKNGDPNIQNRTGDSPLHYAASENHVTTLALLIEFGADVNLMNHGDQTAYDVAKLGRHKTREAVEFLGDRMDESEIAKDIERELTSRSSPPPDLREISPPSLHSPSDDSKEEIILYHEGWLEKQGYVRKGFLPRYCRLYSDGILKYYVREEDTEARGSLNVKDMIETHLLEYPQEDVFGFGIKTNERFWKFKSGSDRERREWIAMVHAVNYGISLLDVGRLNMEISRVENTNVYVYRLSRHSFLDHLSPTSILQAGWMYKLGAPLTGFDRGSWRKRWITIQLDDNAEGFMSYREGIETDVKGTIMFGDILAIGRLPDTDVIRHRFRPPTVHCFKLVTEARTWVFSCHSEQELFIWMDKISEMTHLKYSTESVVEDSSDTTFQRIMRKISDVPEWMGFAEEYVPMKSVQPTLVPSGDTTNEVYYSMSANNSPRRRSIDHESLDLRGTA